MFNAQTPIYYSMLSLAITRTFTSGRTAHSAPIHAVREPAEREGPLKVQRHLLYRLNDLGTLLNHVGAPSIVLWEVYRDHFTLHYW